MMKKTLCVPFHKLHALGNDFIVWSGAIAPIGDRPKSGQPKKRFTTAVLRNLAKAICERHTGIGADGLLLVQPGRQTDCDAAVRFFNADGSEAEMSGNGIRCVGAVLIDSGDYETPLRLGTLAGVKVIETVEHHGMRWDFRVGMGDPILAPQHIPFAAKGVSGPVVRYALATRYGEQQVTITSMGNPHCSLFVENFDQIDWPEIGREIEVHPLFPNRTNVEFIRVVSRRRIEVRFWERGVGITASSGTGSCAAAVASILNGFTDRTLEVETTAGKLGIGWPRGDQVTLTGPAVKIAQGNYYYAGK